jgi:hypothetical protein
MRAQVISLLVLITSFHVSCSSDQDGPPSNRRRINAEIFDQNDIDINEFEEEEEVVNDLFFGSDARSLIGDDTQVPINQSTIQNQQNQLNLYSPGNFSSSSQSSQSSQLNTSGLVSSNIQPTHSHFGLSAILDSDSPTPPPFQFRSLHSGHTDCQLGIARHLSLNDRMSGVARPSFRWQLNDDNFIISSRRGRNHGSGLAETIRIPIEAVQFDRSEEEFFNIIRRAETETSPPNTRYYGVFIDPEDGVSRYLSLPLMKLNIDEDEETETAAQNVDDESDEETKEDNIINDTSDYQEPEATGIDGHVNPSIMQTPPRRHSTPIIPGLSINQPANYSTPDNDNVQNLYFTPPAGSNFVDSRSFIDPCEVAETIFAQEVSRLGDFEVQRHVSFPDQDLIFQLIPEFDKPSHLDNSHLRAFELNFPIFYKLVSKCPRKYFLPSLALSLQYDEDFSKFLKIFLGIQRHFGYLNGCPDEFQAFFLQLFLNMKTVSKSAFEFFSNSKNSLFFFSDFSTFPSIYGKFSPDKVAEVLSNYKGASNYNELEEFPGNSLRQFILDFDYCNSIESFHIHPNFSKYHFPTVFYLKNLFNSEHEFDLSVYRLFKFSYYSSQYFMKVLFNNFMVKKVLKFALKEEDFGIVETLFMNFELELNTNQPAFRRLNRSKIPNVTVNVTKISKSFCMVKLTFKKGNHTRLFDLILPLF